MAKVLDRFDFNPGPTSADSIEEGLWIGNLSAAVDKEFLDKIQCTNIVTVDSCPLPKRIQLISGMRTFYLQITDMPHEDLLSHLEETYQFISKALLAGQVVLVHCYFGVSRSSAIVIAYLMKKHSISYAQAYEWVKSKRTCVCPNEGFVSQLQLYEKMRYTLEKNLLDYRLFRLKIASEYMRKARILPTDYHDVIKSDPALPTVKPDPIVYKCYNCRRVIANKSNIIPHAMGQKVIWTDSKSFSEEEGSVLCKEYLLCEPLAWMNVTNAVEGKLNCPRCKSKLGSFNWIMGTRCVCRARMSPCFYLIPSKLDLSNMVQNVEATI